MCRGVQKPVRVSVIYEHYWKGKKRPAVLLIQEEIFIRYLFQRKRTWTKIRTPRLSDTQFCHISTNTGNKTAVWFELLTRVDRFMKRRRSVWCRGSLGKESWASQPDMTEISQVSPRRCWYWSGFCIHEYIWCGEIHNSGLWQKSITRVTPGHLTQRMIPSYVGIGKQMRHCNGGQK